MIIINIKIKFSINKKDATRKQRLPNIRRYPVQVTLTYIVYQIINKITIYLNI